MQIIEKPDPQVQLEFLEKAVSEWGWAIFPLHKIKRNYTNTKMWCGCQGGFQCSSIGKHPARRWTHREEYPDLGEVKRLLADGYTGWGMHLGWSKTEVLDIDPRNFNEQSIRYFKTHIRKLMAIKHCLTGSEGDHFYFDASEATDKIEGVLLPSGERSTVWKIEEGIELLSGQHYVVLPYSPHKSGRLYLPDDIKVTFENKGK